MSCLDAMVIHRHVFCWGFRLLLAQRSRYTSATNCSRKSRRPLQIEKLQHTADEDDKSSGGSDSAPSEDNLAAKHLRDLAARMRRVRKRRIRRARRKARIILEAAH